MISVKFTKSEYFGDESVTSAVVKVQAAVLGTIANATDFYILPLTYGKYNEMNVTLHTNLPTISELVGGVDPPPEANGR